MTLGFYLRKDLRDLSVMSDDESGPLDTHHFLAVHVLLFVDAVGLSRLLVYVAKKREGQIVLVFKFRLGLGGIRRNANNYRIIRGEFLRSVAELAGLYACSRAYRP